MSTMAAPTIASRPFTTDDLDAMPEDGRRYELIDGQLLVSPSPAWQHQEVGLALAVLLRAACPRQLRVVAAPFDVRPDRRNTVQPDVLVASYEGLTFGGQPVKNLPTAPLLAVEVLSPSSGLTDPTLKRAFYARLGVRSFWIVDPDPHQPALTAFDLADGQYRELATVVGDETFEATEPFAVTIVAAELVRGLFP